VPTPPPKQVLKIQQSSNRTRTATHRKESSLPRLSEGPQAWRAGDIGAVLGRRCQVEEVRFVAVRGTSQDASRTLSVRQCSKATLLTRGNDWAYTLGTRLQDRLAGVTGRRLRPIDSERQGATNDQGGSVPIPRNLTLHSACRRESPASRVPEQTAIRGRLSRCRVESGQFWSWHCRFATELSRERTSVTGLACSTRPSCYPSDFSVPDWPRETSLRIYRRVQTVTEYLEATWDVTDPSPR
jgi:hypothetical protein